MDTKIIRPRGRPRVFDPQEALTLGQRLFHAQDYESVGLATLTEQLGIKPPSFYRVFESKLGFFEKVLARYTAETLPLEEILRSGRTPAEALSELLERAAQAYSADPEARGCLVLESARGSDNAENVRMARAVAERRRAILRDFVAATHPKQADVVTDFITSTKSGLSASARQGMEEERLLAVAKAAAAALDPLIGQRPR